MVLLFFSKLKNDIKSLWLTRHDHRHPLIAYILIQTYTHTHTRAHCIYTNQYLFFSKRPRASRPKSFGVFMTFLILFYIFLWDRINVIDLIQFIFYTLIYYYIIAFKRQCNTFIIKKKPASTRVLKNKNKSPKFRLSWFNRKRL